MSQYLPQKGFALGLVLAGLLLLPIATIAATFTGKINGVECALHGDFCPIDKLDPHVVAEPDFVLQTADGAFHFLVNLPRETKVRYVLDNVEVVGDLNEKYNAINVDELKVQREGGYKTVWSKDLQARSYEDLRQPGSSRP